MSLFKTQSLLTIQLETFYSALGTAGVKRILYVKPDNSSGYWTATASGTKLVYDVGVNDIDQVGNWKLQAYIEVGSLKGYGSIVIQKFEKPLT